MWHNQRVWCSICQFLVQAGQPARLALIQRLLCVLAPMPPLQRAVGQGADAASMQKVAALARAQLVRIARMPPARSLTYPSHSCVLRCLTLFAPDVILGVLYLASMFFKCHHYCSMSVYLFLFKIRVCVPVMAPHTLGISAVNVYAESIAQQAAMGGNAALGCL